MSVLIKGGTNYERILGSTYRKKHIDIFISICNFTWKCEAFRVVILQNEATHNHCGYIGLILGPTIFGRISPSIQSKIFPVDLIQMGMLETLAWVGILFLLMDTGLEVNFSSVWKQKRTAIKISICDIIIPILISAFFIFFLPDRYIIIPEKRTIFVIFLATIMTISAMPVTIRALHDLKLVKSDLGFLIISVLSINDIIGWVIFTIVLGVFSKDSFEWLFAFKVFFFTISFVLISTTLFKNIVDKIMKFIKSKYPEDTGLSITFIAILGLLSGAVTQSIGIHALFGFFVAGLIAGESDAVTEKDKNVFTKMVYAIFVPIFFASIGLKMDFLANFDLFLTLFLTIIGVTARYIAAYIGAKISKIEKSNMNILAIAHTPGGEMHIVIGMLALHLGLINEIMFVSIIGSAIISSVILGPWLGISYNKYKKSNRLKNDNIYRVFINKIELKREEIIEKLCEIASKETKIDREILINEVIKRESQGTTAIEKGVAFPHAKVEGLEKPIIVFSKSNYGIEWNSPDGIEINMIFLILTPIEEYDKQLSILSSIARFMSSSENRTKISKAETEKELYKLLK